MKLCADAPNLLKDFERAQDRIDRLIRLVEINPKKKDQAPAFRTQLTDLGLMRLYVRAKFGHASVSSPAAYARLRQALRDGDLAAAEKTAVFQLFDFDGKEVKATEILPRAQQLEAAVRRVVGLDNFRADPPPSVFFSAQADSAIGKVEKFIKKIQKFPPEP